MRLCCLHLVSLLCVIPGIVTAQEPAEDAQQEEVKGEAAEYLQSGLRNYKEQRYLEAAADLTKAHALDPRPRPLLLFNIAQAYRKAGRPRDAQVFYERFLAADPQSELRGETEGYLNDMKALIAEKERAEEARSALAMEQRRALERKRALATEKDRRERAQRALLLLRQRAEQERRRPLYRRGWFWGVLAASVAVAGAGIGLAVAFAPRDTPTDGGFVEVLF